MPSLCEKCAAVCCRYIALPFDTPSDRESFEEIRWFLMHEGVSVFVSEGQWYVSATTPCRHLTPEGSCGIYEERPQICRDYSSDGCDYRGGDYEYELLFTHPEQLLQYAEKKLAAEKGKKSKGKRKK